jgi:CSLREA domain-containing protein
MVVRGSARRLAFVSLLAAWVAALALIGVVASPVRGATITVNTTTDEINADGDCSLREAIHAANTNEAVDACPAGEASPTADIVSVPAGTYQLVLPGADEDENENGDLDLGQSADFGEVPDHVTINGAGAALTIIDAGDIDRVFDVQGGSATISNLTAQNGTSSNGGGVRADDGSVTITDAIIRNNLSTGDRRGGGLYVHHSVSATLQRVTVSGNSAWQGGGIYNNSDGTDGEDGGVAGLVVENSIITGNSAVEAEGGGHGGGIYNDDDATLVGTGVTGNTADEDGAGIFNDGWDENDGGGTGATLALTRSTVSGANTADEDGGGIFNLGGAMTITDSTVSGNVADEDGGGIGSAAVQPIGSNVIMAGFEVELMGIPLAIAPEMEISGSTISGNTSGDDAGGIENDGDASLLNTTVSGNTAADEGGGIYSDGAMLIRFTTITLNTAPTNGGGIFADSGSDTQFYGSIFADNSTNDCFNDDAQTESFGSNVTGDPANACDLHAASDQAGVADPRLGPLADNGGPTRTHALLFNSPAVDAVTPPVDPASETQADFVLAGQEALPPACPTVPAADQRGVARPQDGDADGTSVCDAGSFELQPATASINDITVVEGDSGTVDAVFTVTLSRANDGPLAFTWSTANGTANAPADYQSANGTVTFVAGDTSETITVRVVGDTIDEPNETFTVTLAGTAANLGDAQGTGTILDDEGPIVTPAPTAAALPDTANEQATSHAVVPIIVVMGLVAASVVAYAAIRRRQPGARR